MRLEGKVCVVTGGATGIGEASALALAREGARVVVGDVNVEEGRKTVEDIKKEGGEALFVECDVSREEGARRLVEETVGAFGRIDVLFNNAGINITEGSVPEMKVEDWRRTFAVNVDGIFWCSRYAIPEMRKNGGGRIINTASPSSFVGWAGNAAYIASKGAVMSLTRAMAMDHAKENIRVNAIVPGLILSPLGLNWVQQQEDPEAVKESIHPIGRPGYPEDVAPVVVFLAQDDAEFATGAPFFMDGGLVAS
ncbi:short-chain dehydrogenase/reductase SDR [Rubrobacter xylanophilus DSM 9941]|uniref:Short-chain dehydrogenase/reductase SDR n=1 Tax=Rubrobacter xylanophilus (strain DSM 9941 / JCM 11954 / NBRC 16129 / PRD-1) TaxID=266117 RepID=Q1AYL3_RUBXD|nr:glucose 1-dehydrogenase [Rubrobacter xylanophilus]ABG03515.1 short-chain dehydrogenase/reductase SDR [Rubrobacter xylanophilus DSM 9941]